MKTDDSMVNTKACMNATSSSRQFMNIVNNTETNVMALPMAMLTSMVMNIMHTIASTTV
jgi:hypothetical protein